MAGVDEAKHSVISNFPVDNEDVNSESFLYTVFIPKNDIMAWYLEGLVLNGYTNCNDDIIYYGIKYFPFWVYPILN